jgi:cation diffusion facilitator CzcD-associated flavoprotein CzcO
MRVLIVGAGFGGIAAAIELRRHGFEDVTILEASGDLGGTWHDNTYPGCACDVPSHFYSFSFAQRRDWTRLCSPQPEILAYLRDVARDHGVDRWIAYGRRVTACTWDDAARAWTVTTDDGRAEVADAVVLATGQLHQPASPRLRGAGTFTGHAFHSARWDHAYDLRGKRVAVIGTGASAVQFLPEIADGARSVTVFQRTGNWFLPRRNRAYPRLVRAAIRRVPGVQAFRRRFMFNYCEGLTLAIRRPETVGRVLGLRSAAFMRWQLRGRPELRRAAWPDYTFGCKRVLFSSAYLPALRRPGVELVTAAIDRLDGDAVVTADGARREVDCLIYATGFRTNDFMFPMAVVGADGADLREVWADGPHAHLGMTVPGFPSLFVLYGPNTNTSGGSIVFYLELQAAYVRQALQATRERGAAAIDVRPEVEAASDRALQGRFAGTAWTRCDSWYQTPDGRIVANWPGFMREYAQAVRRLDPAEFTFVART